MLNFESILFGLLMLIIGCALVALAYGASNFTYKAIAGLFSNSFDARHNKATYQLCNDQFSIMLAACVDTHTRAILANGVLTLRTKYKDGESAEAMSTHTFNIAREFARSTLLNKKERANGYQAQG